MIAPLFHLENFVILAVHQAPLMTIWPPGKRICFQMPNGRPHRGQSSSAPGHSAHSSSVSGMLLTATFHIFQLLLAPNPLDVGDDCGLHCCPQKKYARRLPPLIATVHNVTAVETFERKVKFVLYHAMFGETVIF